MINIITQQHDKCKKVALSIAIILSSILIFYIFKIFLYSRINQIHLPDSLSQVVETANLANDLYQEAGKTAILLDKKLSFYEKDVEDVIEVKHGENFKGASSRYGIDQTQIEAITKTLGSNFNLINPGQDIFIKYNYTGTYTPPKEYSGIHPVRYKLSEKFDITELEIRLNKLEKLIQITKQQNGEYKIVITKLETLKKTRRVHGKITQSLYYDAMKAGVNPMVIKKMIDEYSYDIDFQRDIRKNDVFEAVFEEYYDDKSRKVKDGKLLYAGMNVQGKWYKMYRYHDNFYNEKGAEIRKTLLKTPVDGARISSGFGVRRHPVLGYTRAHKGIDFAAPVGTPIYAAGDGTITFAGWGGGYGNLVSIKHNKEYGTNYAHMSKIAKGIKPGAHVKQRQVIGYIGTTGLSTGPHLHFELVKNGEKINPSKHTIQSINALSGGALKEFKIIVENIEREMATSISQGKPST